MACFKPITAYQPPDGGRLVFHELKDHREVQIPCGNCIGCRLRKQNGWALRCLAEAKMHPLSWFLTLTYNDEHLPAFGSLQPRDMTLFLKRARKALGPFRYFYAGEYGENTRRAHYHMLAFGMCIPDLVRANSVHAKHALYGSKKLEALWGKGFISVGSVTVESARYCASYTLKKINGEMAEDHYRVVDWRTGEIGSLHPEFARMSRRPGLGRDWFLKFAPELFVHGAAVQRGGVKAPIPDFGKDLLAELDPEAFEDMQLMLTKEARKQYKENTSARLEVREAAAHAKIKFAKERKSHAL